MIDYRIFFKFTWAERKVAAWLQDRIGPNRAGPLGLFQPLADGLKLFSKEELDIKAIAKQMQRQSGSFDAKLKAALQNKMVENRSVNLAKDKINFEAKLNGKTVIPITLEIKHVN